MQTDAVQVAIDHELALLTSAVRLDPIQVDALLDSEFREVGVSGRMWDRASTISALAAGKSAQEGIVEVSDMTGRSIAANLVLLTYVSNQAGRRARRSSIWRQSNGVLRLLFHQGTLSDL